MTKRSLRNFNVNQPKVCATNIFERTSQGGYRQIYPEAEIAALLHSDQEGSSVPAIAMISKEENASRLNSIQIEICRRGSRASCFAASFRWS